MEFEKLLKNSKPKIKIPRNNVEVGFKEDPIDPWSKFKNKEKSLFQIKLFSVYSLNKERFLERGKLTSL